MQFRPFRNADPPHLAAIWREAGRRRGLVQPMTVGLLDRYVLNKPYFDPAGLIVADDQGKRVGFVHAGFGPNEVGDAADYSFGATCALFVLSKADYPALDRELLHQSEEYMRSRGTTVMYGGAISPLASFYLGLYGGSELPGILDSDQDWLQMYEGAEYKAVDHVNVLQRNLSGFKPPIDRRMMMLRRNATLEAEVDPPCKTWWESHLVSGFERLRFVVKRRADSEVMAEVEYRDLGPLAATWGVHAVGLTRLEVNETVRRQGWATFLVSETLARLAANGFSLVEAQTMERNDVALAFYHKMGFAQIDRGTVYRK